MRDEAASVRDSLHLLPVGAYLVRGRAPEVAVIVEANAPSLETSGATELVGTPLGQLPFTYYLPDRTTRVRAADLPCAIAIRDGCAVPAREFHLRRPDGSWRVVLVSASPVRDTHGVCGAVAIEQDVTELRRADVEAHQKGHMLDALLEYIPEGIMIADAPDVRIRRQSRYVSRILGRPSLSAGAPAEEHVEVYEVFRADGQSRPDAEELPLTRALRSGEVVKDEEWLLRTPEGMIPILCNAGPIRDETGAVIGSVVAWRDISDRKRIHEALRASEARAKKRAAELQTVLDAVPAAVFITRDANARFMEANRFATDMLRVSPGFNFSESAPEGGHRGSYRFTRGGEQVPPPQLPVQLASAGKAVLNCDLDVTYDDGGVRHLLGNAVPLRDEGGAVFGSVGAFVDVTELKRVDLALREASRRKDEFLGMLSHELRNPLTPIHNSLHILARVPPGSEQATRALAVIGRQVAHMRRLIDDLLDVTRITRGKIQLRRERMELCALLRRTGEDHAQEFAVRGIAFELALPPEPIWVEGDPVRLAQVVGNLLQNAAKFTPTSGRVRLSAEVDGARTRLRVCDSGIGIAPEVLPRLFEPFMQADNSLDRSRGGLGLGLALVKGLIVLHGGTVRAESGGRDCGAEFIIELPCEPASKPETAPRPPGAPADG